MGHCHPESRGPLGVGLVQFVLTNGGKDTSISGTQVSWKTCRAHFVGECVRLGQTKDGVVVVKSNGVEFGVVGYLQFHMKLR